MLSVLRKTAINVVKNILRSPVGSPVADWYRGCATVLCYHRVVKIRHTQPFAASGLQVHRDEFDVQMRWLSEHRQCVHSVELVEALKSGTAHRDMVVVTFDDGYRDNLTEALPILERYRIPATIFIAPHLIDGKVGLWWFELAFIVDNVTSLRLSLDGREKVFSCVSYEEKISTSLEIDAIFKELHSVAQNELLAQLRSQCSKPFSSDGLLLSWEEIRQIAANPLLTIGAHTMTHPNLRMLTEEQIRWEFSESRSVLGKELGRSVDILAYPYGTRGEVGSRELHAAAAAGFLSAFTTRGAHIQKEHASSLHALPRISPDYFDPICQFEWKMSGGFAIASQRGQRFVTV